VNYAGVLTPANDTYNGGAGIDYAQYTSAQQALTMVISQDATQMLGTVTGADVGTDTLYSFEYFRGGQGNDVITFNNTVTNSTLGGGYIYIQGGYNGNDTITGSDNANEVYYAMTSYDNGADSVSLGGGDDTIRAGAESIAANDTYNLGAGNDYLQMLYDPTLGGTMTLTGLGAVTVTGYGMGTDTFTGLERIESNSVTDLFVINTDYTAFVNGGTIAGYGYVHGNGGILDTVQLGAGINLDLTVGTTHIYMTEFVDMSTNAGANTFTFDYNDIIDMGVVGVATNGTGGWVGTSLAPTREQVVIDGTASDTVLDYAVGANGWSLQAATATHLGHTYNVYNNSNVNAQLLVDITIVQTGILA